MKKQFLRYTLLAALCLLIVSCSASTKVVNSWMDNEAAGYKINNVLVIGISRDNTSQRLFEETFVEAFNQEQISAEASYKTAGWDIKPEPPVIKEAIAKSHADTVLITRVITSETTTNVYPGSIHYAPSPYYYGMYGYYGRSYRVIHTPPVITTSKTVLLESNLYDVKSEKLIWAAQSEAVDPSITKKIFQEFVAQLMTDLRQHNLL
jgi:hypothetical protein